MDFLQKRWIDLDNSQRLMQQRYLELQHRMETILRSQSLHHGMMVKSTPDSSNATSFIGDITSVDHFYHENLGIHSSGSQGTLGAESTSSRDYHHNRVLHSETVDASSEKYLMASHSSFGIVEIADDEVVHTARTINMTESMSGKSNASFIEVDSVVVTSPAADLAPIAEPPSLPNSSYLPLDILTLDQDVLLKCNAAIDTVLQKIGPVEAQIQHRKSVLTLLRRQIRLALGVSAFEYGVCASRCLLPDDPIKITVILSKSQVPTWHIVLTEQLSYFAERSSIFGGSSYVPLEDDDVLDPYFNDLSPTANHFLGNVTHSKQNLMHSVSLVVDSIPVEITVNNRLDLCMLAFEEEVALLVERNELFKRSLLLIRAWWALETPGYVGCSIQHYLNDHHLFVMLAAVFNQYNHHIQSPIQAFYLFLAEYSGFDQSGNAVTRAITIQGIVNFQVKSNNIPQLLEIQPYHIISESLLTKYWQIYNANLVTEAAANVNNAGSNAVNSSQGTAGQEELQRKRSQSSDDDVSSTTEKTTLIGGTPRQEKSAEETIKENIKALSANNLFFFDRSAFNIVHPLTHCNMITEKLSQRRITRLLKVFQAGAIAAASALRPAGNAAEEEVNPHKRILQLFKTICSYVHLWNQSNQPTDLVRVMWVNDISYLPVQSSFYL